MSATDKIKNATQQIVGKAEEAVGKRTDDPAQVEQGKKDQAMGAARQDQEKIKDAVQKD